ncbi:MAG: hypothetical protein HYT80_00250 [Euryarchaeota archaeon]|nr:hypothetical protein [Euryarchaeota archaeon]
MGLTKILRTVTVLSALALLIAFIPAAAAQGGQGQNRPVMIEIVSPDKAKTNKTMDIVNGSAEAKFRVGYSRTSGGGGGGGPMGGGFLRVCQPGTMMNIKLKTDPAEIPGAHIMISPAQVSYDIGQQVPPSAPMQGNTRVWKDATITIHYQGNLTKPTLAPFNLTHEAGTVSGPGCQPSAPTTGNPAQHAKVGMNLTLPYTPPAIKAKAVPKEEGFLPGPGFVVVLLGLALVLALGRRRLG